LLYWYLCSSSDYEPGPGLDMREDLLKKVTFSLLNGRPIAVKVEFILYSDGPGY